MTEGRLTVEPRGRLTVEPPVSDDPRGRITFVGVLKRNIKEITPYEPPDPSFKELTDALTKLGEVVGILLDADDRDAERILGQLRGEHPMMQTFVTQYLTEGGRSLRADVTASYEAVKDLVNERYAPHAKVPERLDKERDLLRERATAVEGLLPELDELATAEGWQGDASENYRAAARHQIDAVKEFGEVNTSTADLLDQAALLHRGTFFAATEAVMFVTNRLQPTTYSGSIQLYGRGRKAHSALLELASNLSTVIDEARFGTAGEEVTTGLTETLEKPEALLASGWPTGTPDDKEPTSSVRE